MGSVAAASAEGELRATWTALGGDDATADDLVARHGEAHRRYHTVEHVAWVLRAVEDLLAEEAVCDAVTDADAVRVAALFHDAVYDPRSVDNERRSADLAAIAASESLGWPPERAAHAARLVLATMTHEPADADEAVLLDADLAILGAERVTYDRYVTAVRAEYGHVDDAGWRGAGRRCCAASSTDRRSSPRRRCVHRAEQRARANLARELTSLTDGQ